MWQCQLRIALVIAISITIIFGKKGFIYLTEEFRALGFLYQLVYLHIKLVLLVILSPKERWFGCKISTPDRWDGLLSQRKEWAFKEKCVEFYFPKELGGIK